MEKKDNGNLNKQEKDKPKELDPTSRVKQPLTRLKIRVVYIMNTKVEVNANERILLLLKNLLTLLISCKQ